MFPDQDGNYESFFFLQNIKSSSLQMSQVLDPGQNVEQATESPSVDDMAAEEFVESLMNSQLAYRTLSSPVGGVVDIPNKYQYCVKGFFVQTISSSFEFMSFHPLSQFVGITEEVIIISSHVSSLLQLFP